MTNKITCGCIHELYIYCCLDKVVVNNDFYAVGNIFKFITATLWYDCEYYKERQKDYACYYFEFHDFTY